MLHRCPDRGESGPMVDLDRGRGVLVALHGHGDEPGSARVWGRLVAPPGWEVVAPGAPRDATGTRSWFDSGPRGVDDEQIGRSVARVTDVVDQVTRSARPVVLAGFSQGAAVVLAAVLSGVRCDAAVTFAGFLPEPAAGDLPRGSIRTPRLFTAWSEHDEVVPEVLAGGAADAVAATGVDVERSTGSGGHEVGREAAAAAREWLVRTARRGPRVSLGLPVDRVGTDLCSAAAIADLSTGYERFGFDAAYVTDHPAPDERWLRAGGHHAMEPTVVLAAAAMVTSHLLLHTNVYVLAYRNPFLAAKAIASLDVVTEGRLVLGVAAGYLRPEFAALGRSFVDRAALLDEALELLPRIWSGEVVEGEGIGWSARSARALPQPLQVPHPPIWVGGNSVAAIRRAVLHGQGWCPFPTPGDVGGALRTASICDLGDLRRRLERLERECDEAGRSDRPTTCFVPFTLADYLDDPVGGLAPLVDEVAELDELGVDWVALMAPGEGRSEVLDRAAALAAALGR